MAVLALVGAVATGCRDGGGASSSVPATPPMSTPTSAPVFSIPSLDDSGACRYLASTVSAELTRWTGSADIVNAPVAEPRLGPQPDGGVPGVLVDGCVWEARGPDGGHVGVAVERFTNVDIDALEAMAASGPVTSAQLAEGGRRWNVAASRDSPSGAVLVGDRRELIVVRVESHSDDPDRTFLAGILDGAERFFVAIGDAVAASRQR